MIKKIIRQYKIHKPLSATKNIIYNVIYREKKMSYGMANPNKIFYVIRPVKNDSRLYLSTNPHLLANYFYVLSHIKYAKVNNWIPIVDFVKYPIYLNRCGSINGVSNPWEFFWEQPSDYTLEEIYNSKNVILSKRNWFWKWDMGYDIAKYKNSETITFYNDLMNVVPLNTSTQHYVLNMKKKIMPSDGKVLGVSIRLGGHSKRSTHKAPGHPIAPDPHEVLDNINELIDKHKITHVFLASDDAEAIDVLNKQFNEKLIYIERNRVQSGAIYDEQQVNPMYCQENIFKTTLSYLAEMEILATCDCIIGSITSGFRYSIIRNNNNYKHCEILDYGRFNS